MDLSAVPRIEPGSRPPLEIDHVVVDGMRVRVAHHHPGGAGESGTVVLLTGRAEFIEKYHDAVGELAARGFAAVIFEWRGQGGSDRFLAHRHRGHVRKMEDYLADLDAVVEALEHKRLPRPFLMLGHSMGGHVGLRYLRERPGHFAAAVMSAPMFGINLRPYPEPVARFLCELAIGMGAASRYAPGQRDFDLARLVYETNQQTSCPVRYGGFRELLELNPELALGGVTFGWLRESLRSIALTRRPGYVEDIRAPVLVCQAARETIVCNRAQGLIARRLPAGRLLVFEDAMHELMLEREPIRSRFFDTFESFVRDARAPG